MKNKILSRAVMAAPALGLVVLAFVAFVSLGLPDGLLGVAWPRMRADFGQPLDSLGLLLGALMGGYLVSSFGVGWIMRRLGVGRLLGFSSLATAVSLCAYTLVPYWFLILPFGVLAGLGAGAIDAGLNSYVEHHFHEGLMQWLHASFGVGITLGPAIMTAGLGIFDAWRPGYLVVAGLQTLLAVIFLMTHKKWEGPAGTEAPVAATKPERVAHPFAHTLRHPRSWLSAMIFFVYAGIELGIGHWAYTILTESRGVSPGLAGIMTTVYWGSFTAGRILAGLVARKVKALVLVWSGLGLAVAGVALFAWNPLPALGFAGLALTGFALAPIFPGLVSTTSLRVGQGHTASTIGMQMSFAGLGVGVLPGLIGAFARQFGLETIGLAVIACAVLMALVMGLSLAAGKSVRN